MNITRQFNSFAMRKRVVEIDVNVNHLISYIRHKSIRHESAGVRQWKALQTFRDSSRLRYV
jgi:hypothetical protein